MKYRTTLGALALAVGLVSTAHAADFKRDCFVNDRLY